MSSIYIICHYKWGDADNILRGPKIICGAVFLGASDFDHPQHN